MNVLGKSLFGVMALFFVISGKANAQSISCPEGYAPTGGPEVQGCAPIPGFYGGGGQVYSGPAWAKRWGAIAVDGKNGKFGGAESLTSEGKAKKAAIAECKKNGGTECKSVLAYYNQCGVLVWGDTRYESASGPVISNATNLAMATCNKATQNCKPYYQGCSYPERVK